MFQNTNTKFEIQMANKNYRSNKSRNTVSILAITLTSFMIITVLTVGFDYINFYNLQQLQLLGTTGSATLNQPTSEQLDIIRKNSKVDKVGIRKDVIPAGNVDYLEGETGLYYAFRYYDDVEWENHRKPVLENMEGHYPQVENEVMIATWVLKKMGNEAPKLREKLKFSYELDGARQTGEFILSGYFDEYDNAEKDGSVAYVLVSSEFMNHNKIKQDNELTIADISFREKMNHGDIDILQTSLSLQPGQNFRINPKLQTGANMEALLLAGFIIFCIIICGYLLIYNIFDISVIGNIHYYGQLKVIGITEKQIRNILLLQGGRQVITGVLWGVLSGLLFSSSIVPVFLETMLEKRIDKIDVNLWIILGTILFTCITVLLAILKPATIAGRISPVEAVHYEQTRGKRIVNKRRNPTLFQMAVSNIFRDKKRCFLVVLSMVLGTTFCLSIGCMVSGMNADNYVKNIMHSDIELKNMTAALGYDKDITQVFDKPFMDSLEAIYGICNTETIIQHLVVPEYDEEIFGEYIGTQLTDEKLEKDFLNKQPDLFYSQLIGINASEKLRKEYSEINWAAFDHGDICLIPCSNTELLEEGEKISFRLGTYDNSSGRAVPDVLKYTIRIGGILPETYNNYGSVRSMAPHIVVSQKYLEQIADDGIITNIMIQADKPEERNVTNSVAKLVENNKNKNNIIFISALEKTEGLKQAKVTLYGLGGSLAIVLAMIGIVNFVNVIYTDINERKRDFTIMESIGVEKKQMIRMIMFESFLYFFIIMTGVLTIGSALLAIIYRIFSNIVSYAEFKYPIYLLVLISCGLFVICYFVPKIVIKKRFTETIIERMKSYE